LLLKAAAAFQVFGLSDIGKLRPKNEDEWAALPEVGFFALADGMGGHKAGDIAAKEAIRVLCNLAKEIKTEDSVELIVELRYAIEKMNRQLFEMSRTNEALHGMGTTLCCLYWSQNTVIYAHIGDSRIYRYRNGQLEQLTQDHSLFAKWLATGKIAQECETPFPYKNVITRAVGTGKKANPEIAIETTEEDDLYLLCTDGLTDMLSPKEIEEALGSSPDLESCVHHLIDRAKFKGGSDNMTVLIVRKPHGKNLLRQQRHDLSRPEGLSGHGSRAERASLQPL
jgi:serine/threonine protein phosphatase PrpC